MHFTYETYKTNGIDGFNANLVVDGKEVAWIKNALILDQGKTLQIGHMGVTTTELGNGYASILLCSLKDEVKITNKQNVQIKICNKVERIVFAGIDLNKNYWDKFLTKYNARNIGRIPDFLGLDSFSINYSDL